LKIIHISTGGPDRYLTVAGKTVLFEEHPYCGPIVLHKQTKDPIENQPKESDLFWVHYDAWAMQGKRVKEVDGKVWCEYETDTMKKRARD
jgi:hypothetical protein